MKKNYVPTIALVAGLFLIFWSISDGGSLEGFIDIPSIIITVFGSFCALLISYPLEQIKKIPTLLKKLITSVNDDRQGLIDSITDLSRTARSQGLLALDNEIENLDNEFLIEGLKMVVDGMDPDTIQEILETKIDNMENRHSIGQGVFLKWAELAPAFGMIGTLIGLINMLGSLSDPSTIGTGMAVALLTTFYGSLLANLIFIPIAQNLQSQTETEALISEMIMQGVLAIQAGQNPRNIEQKLTSYLDSSRKRERIEQEGVLQSEGQGYV